MSLIQEALKRQQEEAKKQGAPIEAAQPPGQEPPVTRAVGLQVAQPVAPPQPVTGTADGAAPAEEQQPEASKGPSKGKKMLGLAIKIVPIALILAGGIWWITKSMMGSRPVPQPSTPAHTTPATTRPQTTPGTTPPAPTPQTSNTTTETSPVGPTPTEPPQNTTATSSTEVTTSGTDAPAQEVTPPPPVQWPMLTVTGVVGSKEKGAAKINNVIVDVGQSIDGVKVISLGVRSVELEYLGQRRNVRVGGSTQ